MSNIGGKVRESQDFSLCVGLGEVEVLCINPNREQFKEILGMDLKEESKADEYIGESKDGNRTVRIDVWVRNVKSKKKDKIVYFLEDKKRVNKDETKKQYINNVGVCSWADDPNNLPDWFSKRDYRQAYNGEEELYSFMRQWLSKLDTRDAEATLQLEWKDLMKGKVDAIRAQIGGEYSTNLVAAYTVKTVTNKETGEEKEFQSIYNKAFLAPFALKNFRVVDYDKDEIQDGLRKKKSKDLKPHERFVVQLSDPEHGVKDAFLFKDVKPYDPAEFLQASNEVLDTSDPSY
jgi:hypothetical protein